MKPALARMILLAMLTWASRSYSLFGDGSFAVELLNIGALLLVFALIDRLITNKLLWGLGALRSITTGAATSISDIVSPN